MTTRSAPHSSEDEYDQDELDPVVVVATTTTPVDDSQQERLMAILVYVADLTVVAAEYICSGLPKVEDYCWITRDALKTHLLQCQKEARHGKDQPCVVTPRGVQTLLAFRAWLDYCLIRNQPTEVQLFTRDVAKEWHDRLTHLECESKQIRFDPTASVTTMHTLKDWDVFEQGFIALLSKYRSSKASTPLCYIIREKFEVDAVDLVDEYESIDEELIATASLTQDSYANSAYTFDNGQVFDLFAKYFTNSPLWHNIAKFEKKKDGRAAFETFRAMALGPNAKQGLVTKAYKSIDDATYGGDSRFTFEQYVSQHLHAHNDLARHLEPMSEERKVVKFLDGIKDPRLAVVVKVIQANPMYTANFDATRLHITQYLLSLSTTTPKERRNVSGLGQANPGRGNARGGRGQGRKDSKRPRGTGSYYGPQQQPQQQQQQQQRGPKAKIRLGHYSHSEFHALSSEEKQQLKDLRASSVTSKKQRTASAVSTSTVSSITADPTPPTEVHTINTISSTPTRVALAAAANVTWQQNLATPRTISMVDTAVRGPTAAATTTAVPTTNVTVPGTPGQGTRLVHIGHKIHPSRNSLGGQLKPGQLLKPPPTPTHSPPITQFQSIAFTSSPPIVRKVHQGTNPQPTSDVERTTTRKPASTPTTSSKPPPSTIQFVDPFTAAYSQPVTPTGFLHPVPMPTVRDQYNIRLQPPNTRPVPPIMVDDRKPGPFVFGATPKPPKPVTIKPTTPTPSPSTLRQVTTPTRKTQPKAAAAKARAKASASLANSGPVAALLGLQRRQLLPIQQEQHLSRQEVQAQLPATLDGIVCRTMTKATITRRAQPAVANITDHTAITRIVPLLVLRPTHHHQP